MYHILKDTPDESSVAYRDIQTEASAKIVLEDLRKQHIGKGESRIYYCGKSLFCESTIYTIGRE